MSFDEKLNNTGEDLAGKAKEAAGDLTGDQELKAEGKVDQVSASLKNVAEDAKEKAHELEDKAKEAASGLGANLKAAADKIKEGFQDK